MDKDRWDELKSVDPKTVDRDTLVEVSGIQIDENLPKEERVKEFVRQVKNPYCYLDNGVVVKLSFTGEKSMEEVLKVCAASAAKTAAPA